MAAVDIFVGGQMTDLPSYTGTSFDGTELFEIVSPGKSRYCGQLFDHQRAIVGAAASADYDADTVRKSAIIAHHWNHPHCKQQQHEHLGRDDCWRRERYGAGVFQRVCLDGGR